MDIVSPVETPRLLELSDFWDWRAADRLAQAARLAGIDWPESERSQRRRWEDWIAHRWMSLTVPNACARDVLLRAASEGAPLEPSCANSFYRARLVPGNDGLSPHGCIVERPKREAPGMWGICDTLDAGLIEAFLAAGHIEDADVSAAVDARRNDLLDLYRRYGVSLKPRRVIDGSRYVRRRRGKTEIVVPEGIEEVGLLAFGSERVVLGEWGERLPCHLGFAGGVDAPWVVGKPIEDCVRIELPSTLRRIGPMAFRGIHVDEVTIPPSVEYVGIGAFFGARRVTVYDTISPEAFPADCCLDLGNGIPNSPIGWLGVNPWHEHAMSIWNAELSDFKVIVQSAETDEVLYRVLMPLGSMVDRRTGRVPRRYCALVATLTSSWGRAASFAFGRLDEHFDELPNRHVKYLTAQNRLGFPVDLSDEARQHYEALLESVG